VKKQLFSSSVSKKLLFLYQSEEEAIVFPGVRKRSYCFVAVRRRSYYLSSSEKKKLLFSMREEETIVFVPVGRRTYCFFRQRDNEAIVFHAV
jgi:hypothetical protein